MLRSKKYGKGWGLIRRAALKRAKNKCELGDHTPWGRCTATENPKLIVHHIGPYAYVDLWPILSLDDAVQLLDYAYKLGGAGHHDELEDYLARNPEFYPVLCPRHHSMFHWYGWTLLKYLTREGRAVMEAWKEEK